MPETLPRRRLLLGAAAALPLLGTAGCRSQDLFAGPDPLAGPPRPAPGVTALRAVIAAERNLIGLYRSAVGGRPDLAALLSQHQQHLTRLRARLIVPPGSAPGAGAAGPAAAKRNSPGPAPAASVARLRAAEQASAASLVQRLETVQPSLAQLFASIAASHATHASALSALGNRSR